MSDYDFEVIDERQDWDKFYNHIKEIAKEDLKSVGVGLFDNDNIIDKAYKNEFGDPPRLSRPFEIPQRSFLRHVFDANEENFYNYMKNLATLMFNCEITLKDFLSETGEEVRDEIVKFIESSYYKIHKPNAAITILKKGHDQPLIDTGEMVDSIDYRLSKE